MDMGSVVLFVEIMLLIAGWLLFQHARTELTATAAQAPVLSEVKALEKIVSGLLEQIKLESGLASAQLEARCIEARDLLAAMDRRLQNHTAPALHSPAQHAPVHESAASSDTAVQTEILSAEHPASIPRINPRYQNVYTLADEGLAPPLIAQNTGYSEGEIELILGLRNKTA